MEKTVISVIVLAKNEELRIRTCLASLLWADEIIVIDNDSRDTTRKIASAMGAKVIHTKEGNFSKLRNLGASEAHGDWLLYVDADEKIPENLRAEIMNVVTNFDLSSPKGYFIQRTNYYMGVQWPVTDKMQRLIYKTALRGWVGDIHETARIDGDIATLVHPLLHYTHRTLEEMVDKTNEWSETEARLRFKTNHPSVVWWRLIRVMLTGFFRSFFLQSGSKAGTVGWIESIYQGFSMFITYAKLWELQQRSVFKSEIV